MIKQTSLLHKQYKKRHTNDESTGLLFTSPHYDLHHSGLKTSESNEQLATSKRYEPPQNLCKIGNKFENINNTYIKWIPSNI